MPPTSLIYLFNPIPLVAWEVIDTKRLPRLMLHIVATGPTPWVGYTSAFRINECWVRQADSEIPFSPNSAPLP